MDNNEFLYGKNAIEALLEANKRNINKIYLAKGIKYDSKLKTIVNLAKKEGVNLQEVPKEKLNAMVQGAHQGIVASVAPIEYEDLEGFLAKIKNKKNSLIIILDGVEDPHNLGAIARTSLCAGVEGIIIPKRRSSQVTSIVEKTSAGAISKIPIVQVNNISKTIEKLKEKGFWIVGAEGSGDQNYFEIDYNMDCALVLGGENKGISKLVQKNCDYMVKIPMPGEFNSLNVSNAASIMIYEVVRQKLQSNK